MVQVDKSHYKPTYDSLNRWNSYYHQISLCIDTNPNKILEVGPGNYTVYNYLKHAGLNVESLDFDPELKPDHVGDLRKLPFEDNSYDIIMANQVFEHLTWDDVTLALNECHRVTSKHLLIGLPNPSINFNLILKMPLIRSILKREWASINLSLQKFWRTVDINGNGAGEHYWELGCKNHSIREFRAKVSDKFKIVSESKPMVHPNHYYFLLEKK